MEIRVANKDDYPKLRKLWNLVFDDSPDFVDMIYEKLDATGYVVYENNTIVSSLTFFEAGEYKGSKIKMSYAICTHPDYRGKNYAKKLISFVCEKEIKNNELSLICPAEASLIQFYSQSKYQPFFYAREIKSKISKNIDLSFQSITAKEYGSYRELFLTDIPHIKINQNFLDFIEKDSLNSNSLILVNNGDAICVVEDVINDTVFISELLVNPKFKNLSFEFIQQIGSTLANHFKTKNYRVRTIAKDKKYAQGLIYQNNKNSNVFNSTTHEMQILPYFGFPID